MGAPGTVPAVEALGVCHLSPQNNQENPSHKKLADLHLEKYSFPVEMMICLPNGTVVGSPRQLPPVGPGSGGAEEAASKGHGLRDLVRLRGCTHHFRLLS